MRNAISKMLQGPPLPCFSGGMAAYSNKWTVVRAENVAEKAAYV